MDPYQQQVTQQALAELDRQAAMQGQRTAAEAVAAGAFGGSRFGVREAEEARNLAQVKSQRIFEDLSRNFLQAQQAQQRTAQQLGQLGVQTLQAGQAQVGLGEAGQRLGGVDINRLLSIGGVQQQQEQNVLEAARRTELARQQEPFRRATFASDVLRGVPSSQIRYTESPSPSLLQQVAGLGIAGLSTLGALGGTGGISSLLG
jgi:predicted ATPase